MRSLPFEEIRGEVWPGWFWTVDRARILRQLGILTSGTLISSKLGLVSSPTALQSHRVRSGEATVTLTPPFV
jgi:hypothetical protein